MLEDNSPWSLSFLYILQAETLTIFCFQVSSQGCVNGIQPWKIEVLSLQSNGEACLEPWKTEKQCFTLEQRAGLPTAHYRRFRAPKLRFLSCKTTHQVGKHSWGPICIASVGLKGNENYHKFADAYTACYVVTSLLSLIQEPCVFCQHP